MSPTLFRYKKYRFYFFSKEESRIHVHVSCPDGEAKFWLNPSLSCAHSVGLNSKQLKEIENFIKGHQDEIKQIWKKFFKS